MIYHSFLVIKVKTGQELDTNFSDLKKNPFKFCFVLFPLHFKQEIYFHNKMVDLKEKNVAV